MLRTTNQDRLTASHGVSAAVTGVLRTLPRDYDYIIRHTPGLAPGINLADYRGALFTELSAIALGPSNSDLAHKVSHVFRNTLTAHDFPSCALDVDSFVWD